MNLASCDIETVCNVSSCPDYGKSHCRKDHSLHHKLNRIAIIGVYDGDHYHNFGSDITRFNKWYMRCKPTLVFHGGKFDLKTLRSKGASIPSFASIEDTMLMGVALLNKVSDGWLKIYNEKRSFLNEKLPKGQRHRVGTPRSLKTMAPYYLKVEPFWENPASHDDEEYNKLDCIYTYDLALYALNQLKKDGTYDFYRKYLIPWMKLLLEAEYEGILIDEDKLHEMYAEASKTLKELEKKVHRYTATCYKAYKENVLIPGIKKKYKTEKGINNNIAKLPETFNLGSTPQVLYILTWAGIDTLIEKRNKETNEWLEKEGTNKYVLKRAKVRNKNELAALFLQYREKETEVQYLKQYIEACVDSRIYATFNLDGTRTGRLSSSGPNLQNIKGALRTPFTVADHLKYKIYTVDSSQIEPRMIAFVTQDEQMVKLFQQGRDYHNYATQLMFPETRKVKESEVKEHFKDLRNNVAKHADLSSIYGTGAFTLCTMCLVRGEKDIEQEQAQKWLDEFRSGMKTVMAWKRGLEDNYKRGVKIFDPFGFPVTARDKTSVYMTLFNSYIQGFSSRSIFHASLLAFREFCRLGIDAKPLMWVHDEVVWRLPNGKEEFCKKIIDKYMTCYKLKTKYGSVPLACEGHISDRWEK